MMRSHRAVGAAVRQHIYREIVAPSPPASKQILVGAKIHGAITMHERDERERQKPCRIFRGAGDVCERALCGHPRDAHAKTWTQA